MLELYNTMSRGKEVFRPRNDGKVKMFTCGPSIYGRPHLGNYRSFVWEDVLQRYLEHLGYKVERILNLTDVEDKAISEAEKERMSVLALTGRIAERFHEEAGILRIKLPDFIPRSSTSVDEAVRLIKILLEKGYAYWHEGSVFYDPLKFQRFGRLSRLDMNRWPKGKRRFKRDTYPGRRWNLGDFILWHGWKPGEELFWETEIGKGRPSWNIQDPAVITKHLGYAIDISCGGVDNLYRHHDYNIAIIEAVSGEEFARYWVHGEHLFVNGKKMSKSVGNIVYPEDLLKDGYSGQNIRFYLLYGHHRKRINLTRTGLTRTCEKLSALRQTVTLLKNPSNLGVQVSGDAARDLSGNLLRHFEGCMNDDLNVKDACDGLSDRLSKLLALKEEGCLGTHESAKIERDLRKIDEVLQVIFP